MSFADPAPPSRGLNPAQEAAAAAPDGIHLVLAGPGTGKTTTLVGRFLHLVGRGVAPERILTATFTRAAALEMRQRLEARLDRGLAGAFIGTFHSLSLRLVGAGLSVIDTAERWRLLARLGIRWRGTDDDEEGLLGVIDRAKERLLDPAGFRAWLEAERQAGRVDEAHRLWQAAAHYEAYQRALEAQGLVDFGDLITLFIRRLERTDAAAAALRGRFDHVLIDEYQDVSPAQLAWIAALMGPGGPRNLWVVGDDDQCLYGFRSADPRLILSFQERHPLAVLHRLGQTYRSTPQILALAGGVIAGNGARFDKPVEPVAPTGPRPVLSAFPTPRQEAEWIAEGVHRLLARGDDPRGIAVLVRGSALAPVLRHAFRARGLVCAVRGGVDFWRTREVRAFLGLLRLAAGESLPDAELGPPREAAALRQQVPALAALDWSARLPAAREALRVPPRGYAKGRAEAWWLNLRTIESFATEAGSLAALHGTQRAEQEGEGRADAVVISTIHRAKGLEWDTVFVAGCDADQFPHRLAVDEEEERRILYVALTRARRRLILTWPRERFDAGALSLSPFLVAATAGLPDEACDWRGGRPPPPAPARAALCPTEGEARHPGDRAERPGKRRPVRTESDLAERRARRVERNRAQGHPDRAGEPWTPEEDGRLRQAFAERVRLNPLAAELQRTTGAVATRMAALGLIEKDASVTRYRLLTEPEVARLQQTRDLEVLARRVLGAEAAHWLSTPHPAFDQAAPLSWIGRPELMATAHRALKVASAQPG